MSTVVRILVRMLATTVIGRKCPDEFNTQLSYSIPVKRSCSIALYHLTPIKHSVSLLIPTYPQCSMSRDCALPSSLSDP